MYTNSPLITVRNISPNKTIVRKHTIDTITIHCAAGHITAENLGVWFSKKTTHASANYGVDDQGRIGLYVEEKDASWASYSSSNDNRAVTIEVACDPKPPYAVTPAAYESLIELVTDICQRNGINKLLWHNDKCLIGKVDQQNMTLHKWFISTACPGDWLIEHHPDIVNKVNKALSADTFYRVQVGAFNDIKNAESMRNKLKAAGFHEAFITEVKR